MTINSLENRFNLVDELWIPAAGKGKISLRQAFADPAIRELGGNPIQKLAITKLLLAIAQSAYTPEDNAALDALTVDDFRKNCLDYIEKWRERFWLYGETPFLQMPAIEGLIKRRLATELKSATSKSAKLKAEENARPRPIGLGYYPDMPAENNTILSQQQIPRQLDDSEKALYLVTLMNFALSGKRIEKNLDPLTDGFTGKSVSAKPAPSLGNYMGYLHSHLVGPTLADSLILNLLSLEHIQENSYWTSGLGTAPWEQMPKGEDCPVARDLKSSYMATLLSLSRFVLLKENGVFYGEGIQYKSHKDGWREPGMAIRMLDGKVKLIWADPNKRPWRELSAMLSFMDAGITGGYDCQFLRYGIPPARQRYERIGIWSGGLAVTANAGDQSIKQNNDFIESFVQFDTAVIGEQWYGLLKVEMDALEHLSKTVYTATRGYFKTMNIEDSAFAGQASSLFWQACEKKFQPLLNACDKPTSLPTVRKSIAQDAMHAFEHYCQKDTARQLDAWAKNRPNFIKYLNP